MRLTRLLVFLAAFVAVSLAWAVDGSDKGTGPDAGRAPSGTLIMPDERSATGHKANSSQRKCMKVCKEWGEDCIVDSKLGTRKCRRSCQRFGVECF